MLGSLPANVAFVGIDFAREDLVSVLASAGHDRRAPTFLIWEGVTNYLDSDSVDATLRAIVSLAAPSSRLSFTYIDRRLLDAPGSFPGSERWVESVRKAGEPFTFGLDPARVRDYLAA